MSEVLAAAGLAVGLWWVPLGVVAALGAALLMAAALALHRRVRLLGVALVPSIVVLVVAVMVAVLRTMTA